MTGSVILRGRALDFLRRPAGPDDRDAVRSFEDGGIAIKDGRIGALGDFGDIRGKYPDAKIVDHRPHLLMPGLIDPHLHFVQMQVIGSFGTQLLDWLNRYTFVEEQRFADRTHAKRIAELFLDEMIRQGTTTAAAYCSVHPQSADAFFEASHARNMRMIAGKVMMDRNAPEALTDNAQNGHDDSEALIRAWHGRGRQHYAITPRFAITSTPEQLEAAGALARRYPDCHVQTHLSENADEIAFTQKLYPAAKDYTDVYARFGLLGPKSLMGHCIHLTERERDAMAECGSVAVFCPTSNLFLGSGLFDHDGLMSRDKPVRVAVASDIGGGTSYSMLRTLDEGYKVLQLRGQTWSPLASFWQATRGNAEALGLADKIGTLEPGSDADIIVMDVAATPAMALRAERLGTLEEELFVLQTLGDDRAITETYVAGVAAKSKLKAHP
jgi:guanine deaminase